MKKISASVFMFKVALPVGLAAYALWLLAAPWIGARLPYTSRSFNTILVLACGLVIWKFILSDLVDSVLDCGDHFLVRNRGAEEAVAIADIAWVSFEAINPPRVVLHLQRESQFGRAIAFFPAESKLQMAFENKSDFVVGLNRRIALTKTVL